MIKFGTDGWRDIIGDKFTFANVRACAQGVAHHMHNSGVSGKGIVIGYDTRFASREFAETVAEVMARLGLTNTLLGVDVVKKGAVIAADVTASELLELVSQSPARLVITAIGGQGHVFGRGNQQLSPAVLRAIGRDNFWIAATKQKLQQLDGRPLRSDSGDEELDNELAGIIAVITGYDDRVYYPLQ